MAVERHQEGKSARIHPLVESASAEAHHPPSGTGKVLQDVLLRSRGIRTGAFVDVLLQAVARQGKVAHRLDHLVAIETLEHVAGGGLEDERPWNAVREVVARPVVHFKVDAPGFRIPRGIVAPDEGTRPAHEVELHQVAPVVRLDARLEGPDRGERRFAVLDGEGLLAALRLDLPLGTNAKILVGIDEEPQLIGEIREILVVGRRREEEYLVVLIVQQILDRGIPPSRAVPQVVAFIDDDEPVVAFAVRVEPLGN